MTRFYSIDDANAALPDIERILEDLRAQRDELIRLRDMVTAAQVDGPAGTTTADTRTLRLRMQFLIDQMQAGVTRLVEQDVTLREIGTASSTFLPSSMAVRSGCAGAWARGTSAGGTSSATGSPIEVAWPI